MALKKLFFPFFLFFICYHTSGQTKWESPIQKQGRLGSPLVETSPFVFNDRLYLLENYQKYWDVPGAKPGDHFHEDEVRIRDLSTDKIVSIPLKNYAFATVLTWNDRVYVFAGSYGKDKPWRQITEITMISSSDLENWTEPEIILKASGKEVFFNTAVCRGKDKFILLYETNDKSWKPFTFRYMESTDLKNWEPIPDALYGTDKYVGGPALYFEDDYYYTLYLESLNKKYETRITRSKDLIQWEDAPEGRPFVTFDSTLTNCPLIDPTISESNASDVELCYFEGETILYFTGSNQLFAGDLQWATYPGTPAQLFNHFFKDSQDQADAPPQHSGNWIPVLTASEGEPETQSTILPKVSDKPTPQQLELQERQLGAFIHFGPASYIESDMMSVPAADIFNPAKLDAEQWVKAARSFGAKHIVLTAKHHNGYCLWPTSTTDYSVVNSPWKEGRGDVVAEFVNACRKYDMKIGLYLSGGDKHFGCTSTPDPQGQRKLVGDIHKYFPVFLEQLRELLTNYGQISYLWFDGAYDPFGWDVMNPETMEPLGTAYGDAIRSMVGHLQPGAVVMGGTKPDVRWSGSEQGWAAYPLSNIVFPSEGLEKWVGPQNAGWIPAEANLHTRNTWFWKPDSDGTLREIDFMKKVYLESIGRGANLLVNMTPDTSGLIPLMEVNRLYEFGNALDELLSNRIGEAELTDNRTNNQVFIELPTKQSINLLVMEEDIRHGQFIKEYKIEAFTSGAWKIIAEGQTIGRKRIQPIELVKTDRLRLSLKGSGDKVYIKSFMAYHSSESIKP